jgi:hypothetical protein
MAAALRLIRRGDRVQRQHPLASHILPHASLIRCGDSVAITRRKSLRATV